jgi:hypothetical protein
MSSKFESSVKQIPYAQQKVYEVLSNLENIERVRDRIPEGKVNNLSFDKDSVTVDVSPVGEIRLHIINRDEPKEIKFETEKSPVPFDFWIQILPVTDASCKMKLTIKAELNMFIAGMVKKPLEEGIEKLADTLQAVNYDTI